MPGLGSAVVRLHGTVVGIIRQVGDGGQSRFEPSEEWAQIPAGERPVLGQVFEVDPYSAHGGRTRTGVPIWFEHILPEIDGPLRKAVSAAADVSEARGFELLCLLGADLPGALSVEAIEDNSFPKTVSRREVDAVTIDAPQGELLKVSLSGIQFKISALNGQRGIAVPAANEFGDWIVKFADQSLVDLPRVEFSTMSWAKASGIDVPDIELVEVDGIKGIEAFRHIAGEYAFAIKRYDRSEDGRIHQEDFAQVLGLGSGDAKYYRTNLDTIANVIRVLAPEDFDEFLARVVFMVLSGNDDAHAKNWSLWYPDPSIPRLSPAYDFVSTRSYPKYQSGSMALKLAGVREFERVGIDTFRTLARKVGVDEERTLCVVRESVRKQVAAWESVRLDARIPRFVREFVDTQVSEHNLTKVS